MNNKTIAIDLDGCIHEYSRGWNGGDIYDPPVLNAKKAIKKLKNKGYDIVVFTARTDLKAVQQWLDIQGIEVDEVTNIKPKAVCYIDDRAIRFTNWKDMLNYF